MGSIVKDKLNMFLGVVTSQLEKPYISKSSFILLKKRISMLTEAVVKYMDYLDANRERVASYQESTDKPQYHQTITELPFDPEAKYTIRRGKNAWEMIKEHLEQEDFYDPICINECFPENRQLRYSFINHLKKNEIFTKDTVLFAQHYAGATGNTYFVWKGDKTSEHHTTIRNKTINDILIKLSKYFSCGHKRRARPLTESLMLDKITCVEFQAM